MPEKIMIDTDIGDDIDDALALIYALRSGLDIIGVTTVFRNAALRARMASALLAAYDAGGIPVCAGVDTPLTAPIHSRENDCYTASGEYIPCQYAQNMDQAGYSPQHAVDFLIEKADEYAGQITLIPIGPLTNVAMAIRKAPKTMRRLKGITLMGGVFEQSFGEWNILCDPEAARIVFTSGIPLRAVSLDVTMQCRLERPLLARWKALSGARADFLGGMLDKWFAHYQFECPVLHDPLTIGTMVGDFVCFEEKPVLVELDKERYGYTTVQKDLSRFGAGVISVSTRVDSAGYLRHFARKVLE